MNVPFRKGADAALQLPPLKTAALYTYSVQSFQGSSSAFRAIATANGRNLCRILAEAAWQARTSGKRRWPGALIGASPAQEDTSFAQPAFHLRPRKGAHGFFYGRTAGRHHGRALRAIPSRPASHRKTNIDGGNIGIQAASAGLIALHASTRVRTEAADFSNIAFSAASSVTSTIFSTPLAPMITGTPT